MCNLQRLPVQIAAVVLVLIVGVRGRLLLLSGRGVAVVVLIYVE